MIEWGLTLGSAVIGGVITAVATVAAMRSDLSNLREGHGRRIDSLEEHKETLPDRYVTRREFQTVMKGIRKDLREISESVRAIRDYLLSHSSLLEGDKDKP